VIVCSDCIYDEDLVEILAHTIAALARPDTGAPEFPLPPSTRGRVVPILTLTLSTHTQRSTSPTSTDARPCSSSSWTARRLASSRWSRFALARLVLKCCSVLTLHCH
jgi:hypothetical protein